MILAGIWLKNYSLEVLRIVCREKVNLVPVKKITLGFRAEDRIQLQQEVWWSKEDLEIIIKVLQTSTKFLRGNMGFRINKNDPIQHRVDLAVVKEQQMNQRKLTPSCESQAIPR